MHAHECASCCRTTTDNERLKKQAQEIINEIVKPPTLRGVYVRMHACVLRKKLFFSKMKNRFLFQKKKKENKKKKLLFFFSKAGNGDDDLKRLLGWLLGSLVRQIDD